MVALMQNSAEWLEFRKDMVGASDAPIIMGVSPWITPYKLWEEKLGIKEPAPPTFDMRRGLEREEEARCAFEKETGLSVFPVVKVHPDYPWMMASLDGMDIEERHIVEIKCPGHMIGLSDTVPDKYYPQVQHQLAVTGLDMAYYFTYTPYSTKLIEVKRDDEYIKKMIDKELEFYECLVNFTAPTLANRDYTEREDAEWLEMSAMYLDLQKSMKLLEDEETRMRGKLIALSGGANTMGGGVKLLKIARKGNIDYSAIPELKGVNLEEYRKPSSNMWKITIN